MSEITTARPEQLAAEINGIKEQVRATVLSGAVEIGKRLKEAKSLVPFGQWRQWLQEHVDYSERTAQNLMAVAENYRTLDAQAHADLPLTKAVMLLGIPGDERAKFLEDNPVEDMSTRELKAAIDALNADKAKMQLTIDELMGAKKDNVETIKLKAAAEAAKEAAKCAEAQAIKEKAAAVKLREAVLKAQKEAEDARKKAEELKKELGESGKPIIQQITPPETLAELKRLREQAGQEGAVTRYRLAFEQLKNALEVMQAALGEMDGKMAEAYKRATLRALDQVEEALEEGE